MSLVSRVFRSSTVITAALAVAALGGSAGAMAQQQPPTARIFGTIKFNGAAPANGAVVTAFSGTTLCGTSQGIGLFNANTAFPSQYYVDIDSSQAACSTAGNTISFKVNGQSANETIAVPALPGSAIQLNLTGPSTATTGTATYQAGWNLVGGPTGATFTQANGPLYLLPPGAANYVALPNTQAVSAGQGYWAYFNTATTVNLTGTTTLPATVTAPAGQYIMISNPSPTQTVTVTGADIVYTFDPTINNYTVATTLKPGQGAFAFSNAGGTITLQ